MDTDIVEAKVCLPSTGTAAYNDALRKWYITSVFPLLVSVRN
jgi:hypothetical protein